VNGLKPLKGKKPLIRAARKHSRTMARRGDVFHNGPNGGPQKRAPAGYNFIAENCAMNHKRGSTSACAHQFLSQWMKSPNHRKNLLDGQNKYDGIGIWVDGGKVYATHMMARHEIPVWKIPNPSRVLDAVIDAYERGIQRLTPPYSIRERQVIYGSLFGAGALLATALLPSFDTLVTSGSFDRILPTLKRNVIIRAGTFPTEGRPERVIRRYLTDDNTLITTLAVILCSIAISQTSRFRYILTNGAAAGVGYVVAAAAVLTLSPMDITVELLSPHAVTAALSLIIGSILLGAARRLPA